MKAALLLGALCFLAPVATPEPELFAESEAPSYGWVYAVPNQATYDAARPKGDSQQAREDAAFLERTHWVYLRQDNVMEDRWQRQQALNRATAAGWQIVAVDGDAILLFKPKVMSNKNSRLGDVK